MKNRFWAKKRTRRDTQRWLWHPCPRSKSSRIWEGPPQISNEIGQKKFQDHGRLLVAPFCPNLSLTPTLGEPNTFVSDPRQRYIHLSRPHDTIPANYTFPELTSQTCRHEHLMISLSRPSFSGGFLSSEDRRRWVSRLKQFLMLFWKRSEPAAPPPRRHCQSNR